MWMVWVIYTMRFRLRRDPIVVTVTVVGPVSLATTAPIPAPIPAKSPPASTMLTLRQTAPIAVRATAHGSVSQVIVVSMRRTSFAKRKLGKKQVGHIPLRARFMLSFHQGSRVWGLLRNVASPVRMPDEDLLEPQTLAPQNQRILVRVSTQARLPGGSRSYWEQPTG